MDADRTWLFEPVDTWFFRDGTPFEAGEGWKINIGGAFPPSILTLQGALRTALAMGQGWKASSDRKNGGLPEELGDAQSLGQLRLRGPYLRNRQGRLYPIPRHILQTSLKNDEAEEKQFRFVRLAPGKEVETDLDVRKKKLPTPMESLKGLKESNGLYVNSTGMAKILAGGIPDNKEVVPQNKLWQQEARIGLERNSDTRTAVDKMLYSIIHIRPEDVLALEVLEAGSPEGWAENAPPFIRLGGEGRLAKLRFPKEVSNLPEMPKLNCRGSRILFTVTLITPGLFKNLERVVREGLPDLPGTMISGCIGKLESVGGWDLSAGRSRPTEPWLPVGSTWFYEADKEEESLLRGFHGKCLGAREAYGFGQILIGTWEEIA